MTITNDLTCLRCGAHGPDIEFPLFPTAGAKFGEVCVECDEANPWSNRPFVCVDCDTDLDDDTAYGNRKYGEPRCEDCHDDHRRSN